MTFRQLLVLLHVRDEPRPDCTIPGMAAALNVSKPAITRAVDRLEELGWARRVVDERDRRSVFVCLTAKGCAAAARLPGMNVGRKVA